MIIFCIIFLYTRAYWEKIKYYYTIIMYNVGKNKILFCRKGSVTFTTAHMGGRLQPIKCDNVVSH